MKLDLTDVLTHVGMRYPYAVDEPPLVDEDIECGARVQGTLLFANTGSALLVDGHLESALTLPCSRCLVYYSEPVRTDVSEQYGLSAKPGSSRGRPPSVTVEEDETPLSAKLFDGYLFDLTELIRQVMAVCSPLKPLHDPDCLGLCVKCGCNKNENECKCDVTEGNFAFSGLAELINTTIKK